MTFTNLGDLPHTATAAAADTGKWDTGLLNHGQSKTVTFTELGIHYYIRTTHPWMYGVSSSRNSGCRRDRGGGDP